MPGAGEGWQPGAWFTASTNAAAAGLLAEALQPRRCWDQCKPLSAGWTGSWSREAADGRNRRDPVLDPDRRPSMMVSRAAPATCQPITLRREGNA
eukprot:355862-Chlamydomonas_euryale.AAC.4